MSRPAENEPAIGIGAIDLDGGSDEEPGRARRPIRRLLRAAFLAVTAIGVVIVGWVGWQTASEKNATLSTPSVIGPLQLDGSDDGRSTAGSWQTTLTAQIDLDKTVGAVYLDGTGKNIVFVGGTRLIWVPGSVLDSAFELVGDNEGGVVTGLHPVDAGPLGGTMRCGTAKTGGGGHLTVCGWADHGSVAVAIFTNRAEPDSAALLRRIRSASQTRS